ncbi:CD1375 family protein [Robertmurraya sp. FSL W8-0741]
MVKVYCDLINAGLRVIDQVPLLWREDVRSELENEG